VLLYGQQLPLLRCCLAAPNRPPPPACGLPPHRPPDLQLQLAHPPPPAAAGERPNPEQQAGWFNRLMYNYCSSLVYK
jgi:hypothetical protein